MRAFPRSTAGKVEFVETGERVKWGVVAGITGFVLVVFGTIAYVARGRGSSS